MAVGRIHKSNDEYVCLSSDIKPTTGICAGTMLTELDTGKRFMFWNNTWEEDLTMIYAVAQGLVYTP